MPFGIGFGEMVLIALVLLLFFGAKRLPGTGAALGKGIRDFKSALGGSGDDDDDERPAPPATLPPADAGVRSAAPPPPAAPREPTVQPPPADETYRD